MADWSTPVLTSTYVSVLDSLKNRDIDAAVGFSPTYSTATNLPTGTIRWNPTNGYWEIRSAGGTWSALQTKYNIDVDLLDGQHGSYYLAWANLTGVPATFAPSSHTHDDRYFTETEADARFGNKIVTSGNTIKLQTFGNVDLATITVPYATNAGTVAGYSVGQNLLTSSAVSFGAITSSAAVTSVAAAPAFSLNETDAATDAKKYSITSVAGSLRIQSLSDADVVGGNFWQFERSGNTITGFVSYNGGLERIRLNNDLNTISFANTQGTIKTATADDLHIQTDSITRLLVKANGDIGVGTSSPAAPFHILTSGVGTAVLIESTDDTNVSAPSLVLRRSSPTPAANDYVGQIFFQGMDTTGAATNFARILARIEDPTNGSEDGALYFHTTKLGLSTTAAMMNSDGDFTATGNVTAYSDARLKTNVRTIYNALGLVQNMRGVFFDKNGAPSVGVIAQEMETVLPEVVHEGEYKSVAYGNIVGVLIEAIKEQQSQIAELRYLVAV